MTEEAQAQERSGGRREREREMRRREILNAARDVFVEYGYEHATLDEVARRAEFAKGTLYSYFESKADLFEALVDEEFGRLITAIKTTIDEEADDQQAFVKGVKVAVEYISPGSNFFSIAIGSHTSREHNNTTKFHALVMKRYIEVAQLVSDRIGRGIKNGVFKEYNPDFLAFLLLGMVHSAIHEGDWFDEVHSLRENEVEVLCDIFLNGILKPAT